MVIPSKVNRYSCMNNIVHVDVGWGQQKGRVQGIILEIIQSL